MRHKENFYTVMTFSLSKRKRCMFAFELLKQSITFLIEDWIINVSIDFWTSFQKLFGQKYEKIELDARFLMFVNVSKT